VSRTYWSDPNPRHVVAPPVVIVLSTLGFAAVLGYELGKAAVGIYEHLTGGKL
jgi:hypothetical protein